MNHHTLNVGDKMTHPQMVKRLLEIEKQMIESLNHCFTGGLIMKPDCYKCVHRLNIPGDAHSRCNNFQAKVEGNPTGIRRGWFMWPLNFDPTWLVSCNGFSDKLEDKKPEQKLDPLSELMAMLK